MIWPGSWQLIEELLLPSAIQDVPDCLLNSKSTIRSIWNPR
jgi:hypothetical protein